jgi:hypothetical protein
MLLAMTHEIVFQSANAPPGSTELKFKIARE